MMLVALQTEVSSAQESILVADEPYCDCEIVLEHVVTLGDYDGPGALTGTPRAIARDLDGVYHVITWMDYRILRFTPEGVALEPLGREGRGPGEAIEISNFQFVADSLVTFDPLAPRMTVYDPDFQVVRTAPSPGYVLDSARLPDGSLIVNARVEDADAFGVPLHLLDRDGSRLRSFDGRGIVRVDAPFLWRRRIAVHGEDVWAAYDNHYVIERWSTAGDLLGKIERLTDWFEPYLIRSWGGPDEPIVPVVMDMAVDERGYLRSIILLPSPHWADRLPPPTRTITGLVYPVPPGTGLREGLVEIIDPVVGRVFARGQFEAELYGFVDAEHVFSYREDGDGVPRVDVWHLGLARNK